jgi:TolA-binding protein
MSQLSRTVRQGILALAVLAAAAGSQAAHVITITGQRVDGSDIRAKSDGEIILTTVQGTRSFYPGQYAKAVADKPAEIDRATQLAEGKQYDDAIKLLEDVIVRYRFLDWDNQARAMLPKIYVKKGDYTSAIGAYDKLFAASPKTKEDVELQWGYRQTLLDAKQFDKLEQQLSGVISAGPRADAAKAQIMRGDAKLAQGQVESAALDYLRTVVLYANESDVQPEALFKAADALEKLRDARSKEMFKRLVDEYPSSPQAATAKTRM